MSETYVVRGKNGTVIQTVEYQPLTEEQKELLRKTEAGRQALKAKEEADLLRKERLIQAEITAAASANSLAESRPSMEKHIKKQLQKPLLEMSALGRAALKEDR